MRRRRWWHGVPVRVHAVLATQSLFHAVGLGAGALPLAAGVNWVLKDGLGQLGGVVFARYSGRARVPDATLMGVDCAARARPTA
jgi:hypothetical protein